jgi:hypothetical protein
MPEKLALPSQATVDVVQRPAEITADANSKKSGNHHSSSPSKRLKPDFQTLLKIIGAFLDHFGCIIEDGHWKCHENA